LSTQFELLSVYYANSIASKMDSVNLDMLIYK